MKKVIALTMATLMLVVALAGCAGTKGNDVLTCGVTIFEKMNEQDADGNWKLDAGK